MENQIPIHNIYYLLCYAWDQLEEGALVDVSHVESTELVDLMASVLLKGTRHLLRRGLEQAYDEISEELSGVRGRIDFTHSLKSMSFHRGQAWCTFDTLSVDTASNQIIKATLKHLHDSPAINKQLKHELSRLHRELRDVSDVRLRWDLFRRVKLHSNKRFYRFLLNLCEFVFSESIVDENSGGHRFRDFMGSDKAMARLFETFLRNFYRHHLAGRGQRVSAPIIRWMAESASDPSLSKLPIMRTDIVLESAERVLIVDAKYYKDLTQTYWDKETFRSGHLYQMLAYSQNYSRQEDGGRTVDAMLIYPAVGRQVRDWYQMLGHGIGICTVNLNQPWRDIEKELLALVQNDDSTSFNPVRWA